MTDELLGQLRKDWLGQDVKLQHLHVALSKSRWRPHVESLVEAMVCASVGLLGVWLIWTGMSPGTGSRAEIGAPLLACGLSLLIVLADARRGSFAWRDEHPQQLVETALRRIDASLRIARISAWYFAGIGLFIVGRRCYALMFRSESDVQLWLLSALGAGICAIFLRRSIVRSGRLQPERERLSLLHSELSE